MTYQLLDLFSGIGGFSLGLERSGNFKTVAFCEIEPFCLSVLKKHWPEVSIYEDVTKLSAARLQSDGITVDAICGGFPCQDISTAGKGAGLEGERSGLWFEFHRLIKETQPKIAIIENVSALRSRGLDQVLRSLSEIGYDAEWHCIPASAVGAPHKRDRIWIVAYANNQHERAKPSIVGGERTGARIELGGSGSDMAYTQSERVQGLWSGWLKESHAHAQTTLSLRLCERFKHANWQAEPNVGRVVDGFPRRVDRLRALGNAVVPQIPEAIGRAIK